MKKEGYLITGDDIASMGLTLLPGKEHLKGKFALTKDEIINTYSADVSGISDNVTCVTYERVIPSIYLNLSKSAVNFLASGGSDAITIDTNAPSDQIKIEYDGNIFSYNLNDKTLNITAVSLGSTEKAEFTDNLIVSVGSLTKTITINQEENKLVSVTATGTTSSGTIMNISAAGGTITWTPTVRYTSGWSGTPPSGVIITYSSSNTDATQSNNITTWPSRGVTIGKWRGSDITISAKSSYTTTPVTGSVATGQNMNTVTAVNFVDCQGGAPGVNFPAKGWEYCYVGELTLTSGATTHGSQYKDYITYNFESDFGSWNLDEEGYFGTVSAPSRNTTIGNEKSGTLTHKISGTINGVDIDKTTSIELSQEGNYVTELKLAGLSISYSNISAGATASSAPSINSTGYIVTYKFTSGSSTTTRPTATFGGETTSRTYSLGSVVNGFTAVNSSTGVLTATNRETTIGNARTSGTVTLTNKVTWTPSSSYSAGGVKTATITRTATCTQNGNYVTSLEAVARNFSYSTIEAGATSATPEVSGGSTTFVFSSGSRTTSIPSSTYGALSASIVYSLGSVVNGFTAVNADTGVLTATNRGTTIGPARTSGIVTYTATMTWTPTSSYNAEGAKTDTDTKTATCTQSENTVTALVIRGAGDVDPLKSFTATSNSPGYTEKLTFSSGATAEGNNYKDYITFKFDQTSWATWTPNSQKYFGVLNIASRGYILGAARTGTLTCTISGTINGVSVNKSGSLIITQAVNVVKSVKITNTNFEAPTTQYPAGGGTYSYSGVATYSSGAEAGSGFNKEHFSYITSGTGFSQSIDSGNAFVKVTAASRGTVIGTARTGSLVIKFTNPSHTGYTNTVSSSSLTLTQEGNYVESISIRGGTFSYNNISASATSASPTITGSSVYFNFTSGSKSGTAPSSTYGTYSSSASYTLESVINGFTSVSQYSGTLTSTNRGTTIGNARTSGVVTRKITVTWTPTSNYNSAGTKTDSLSLTATCTQNGNYVTSLEAVARSFSYPTIEAGATSATPSVWGGSTTFVFSSGSKTTTVPSSTYGTLSGSRVYTLGSVINGFTSVNSTSGVLTATNRGTTIGAARTSGIVTYTATMTWTPTSSYNSAGTKTVSDSSTATCTQALNKVVSCTETNNTLSYPSIAAAGGTSTPSSMATARFKYSSGASGDPSGYTKSSSYSMTSANGFSINTTSGVVTATNNTTTSSRTSNTITRTTKISYTNPSSVGGDTVSATITKTTTCTQSVGVKTYANPVVSLSYATIPAKGGTVTPTMSYSQTWGWNGATSGGGTITSGATVSYSGTSVNTTNGSVTASSKGTTVSNITTVTTATATVKLNGKTGTKSATVSQAANEKYKEYSNLVGNITSTTWASKANYTSFWATGTYTEKYTSGATGATGSGDIPWDSVTFGGADWVYYDSVQGILKWYDNTGLERSTTITGKIGDWTYSVKVTQKAGMTIGRLYLHVPVNIGYVEYWNIYVNSTSGGEIWSGHPDMYGSANNILKMPEECALIVAQNGGTVSFSTTYSTATDRTYRGSISGTEQDRLADGEDITVYLT